MLPQPSEQQMAVVTSALEYVCATVWPDGHSGLPAQKLAPLAYEFAAAVHPGPKQALSCGYTACRTVRQVPTESVRTPLLARLSVHDDGAVKGVVNGGCKV